jgi:predicted alpha/beta superfamily hydrolase
MATHVIYKLGPFTVPGFAGERYVRVYLPTERPGARLPVLYAFDGQNIFHDDPSYCGGWYLHHAVSDLNRAGKPAPVIVGIDHGGAQRLDELSPFACAHSRGQVDHLLAWLRSELMPRIHREFQVRRDAAGTAIGGSSMGGLAALYAHFRRPDLYGAALCMSPSLWFADGKIHDYIAARPRPPNSRIYIDAGAREGSEGQMLGDAERLVEHLRARGYDHDALHWRPDPHGRHCEPDWRKRAPSAIEFLFSGERGADSDHSREDDALSPDWAA